MIGCCIKSTQRKLHHTSIQQSVNNLQKAVCMALTKKITRDTKANLLTRQSSLFKRERRGDSPRVIANRLTCQRALCNRRERQGDSYPASKVLSYFFSARHGEARETLQNLCIFFVEPTIQKLG